MVEWRRLEEEEADSKVRKKSKNSNGFANNLKSNLLIIYEVWKFNTNTHIECNLFYLLLFLYNEMCQDQDTFDGMTYAEVTLHFKVHHTEVYLMSKYIFSDTPISKPMPFKHRNNTSN